MPVGTACQRALWLAHVWRVHGHYGVPVGTVACLWALWRVRANAVAKLGKRHEEDWSFASAAVAGAVACLLRSALQDEDEVFLEPRWESRDSAGSLTGRSERSLSDSDKPCQSFRAFGRRSALRRRFSPARTA